MEGRNPKSIACLAVYLACQLTTKSEQANAFTALEVTKALELAPATLREVFNKFKEDIPLMLEGVSNIKPISSLKAPSGKK
jgi:transcription initiation factor TFIIIB Brf1 subunit/transcription initiation factor TFIIB